MSHRPHSVAEDTSAHPGDRRLTTLWHLGSRILQGTGLRRSWDPAYDGGGPSSPPHGRQEPSLERLEPSGERLAQREEHLPQDEGRLERERLGGRLERLGPITRSMAKHLHAYLGQASDGRERNLYMLHEGPLGVA